MGVSQHYQLGILGHPNGLDVSLKERILKHMQDLGVSEEMIVFIEESNVEARNRKFPFCCIFFGYNGANDSSHPLLKLVKDDAVFILPVVEDLTDFSKYVPESLQGTNGMSQNDEERIATSILENFHLLRAERRLFISYRRNESQGIAIQLYEVLEAAGFDVFLDTHSVSPGADFQDMLWHRLADSDIVVLLETPGFRESYWTKEELAKANTTSIQILHLLWPGVEEDPGSAFSHFLQLSDASFSDSQNQTGSTSKLSELTELRIVSQTEQLRARALAARYRDLVDNFLDQAEKLNLTATIQPQRFISLELDKEIRIAVVPAVGVPHAQTYEIIERKIKGNSNNSFETWLLYDERGVLNSWLNHLDWLNSYLPLVSVKAAKAGEKMREEMNK